MAQMDMSCGKDMFGTVMLYFDKFFADAPLMMVENNRDGTYYFGSCFPLSADQLLPDDITDKFGTVFVAVFFQQSLQSGKKLLFDGKTHSHQIVVFHTRTL